MSILLITGGTGSFGNKYLERALQSDHEAIRIFSRDEKKQHDLRVKIKDPRVEFYIGDVRDISSVNNVMAGVTHIFHAAALKQVPSCEFFPLEAVKTNVMGTSNVINSAKKHGVDKFVLLSTDKAAYPINAMGLSKAMAEKIAISEAFKKNEKSNLKINITRYGNVMGSRGSVIPHFVDLVKKNEKITITDERMTRFMMSLDESIDLVTYAMEYGEQGEMYVQKSKSASILQVAEAVTKLFNVDLDVSIIGIRGGEKLYETLVTYEEIARSIELEKYFKIKPDPNYLGYNSYFDEGNRPISGLREYNSNNSEKISVSELVTWFKKLEFDKDKFHD